MASMLSSSEVNRRLKSPSGQTKDYKLVFFGFSVKHTAIRSKSKDLIG